MSRTKVKELLKQAAALPEDKQGSVNNMVHDYLIMRATAEILEDLKCCCLCGRSIEDMSRESHNAFPISLGRCCGECNTQRVLPARFLTYRNPDTIDIDPDVHKED